jgi:hypothetical protein
MATNRPLACSFLIRSSLSWSGLREKVVYTGFLSDGSGGQRIVAGDHDRANSHHPHLVEARACPPDDVFRE